MCVCVHFISICWNSCYQCVSARNILFVLLFLSWAPNLSDGNKVACVMKDSSDDSWVSKKRFKGQWLNLIRNIVKLHTKKRFKEQSNVAFHQNDKFSNLISQTFKYRCILYCPTLRRLLNSTLKLQREKKCRAMLAFFLQMYDYQPIIMIYTPANISFII